MTLLPHGDCPTETELAALLEGDAAAAARDPLLAHLRNCPGCTATLASLASGWSRGHLVGGDRPGDETRHLCDRIAGCPPEVATASCAATDHAAIPRAAPVIPGVADLEPVGRGGMGIVYRGRDTRLDRLVAVKILRPGLPLTDAARRRTEREALMLARLDHPNVVTIHAAGDADGTPYLVMEWVAGPTLRERIRAAVLPPREAARIARDLARALEQVHALGIIHRDVKPANVLLAAGSADGTAVPKLADFGLARPEDAPRDVTRADDVLGTPGFMAPEQTGLVPTLGEAGPAGDIHGLGGTLFAMLTGHAPYEAATPLESMQRSVRGELADAERLAAAAPADLRTIVEKCLHPAPARRYRSAGELADDLERLLDGRPVLARPIGPAERAVKWMRRRPIVAAALTATAALALVAIGGGIYHVARIRQANAEITRGRDRAEEALAIAQRSLERLTGESIRRMLLRGQALDEGDRDYLRQVRDEFSTWPLGPDPRRALTFRADGLRQVANLFASVGQFDEMLACLEREHAALEALERLAPDDVQLVRRRLDLLYQERRCLDNLGRPGEVAASARRALAILESAADRLDVSPGEIADTRIQLGNHLARSGEVEEAFGLIGAGLADLRRLRAATPHDQGVSRQLMIALHNAAGAADNAGWHAARREWLEELLAVSEDALGRFTEDRESFARGAALGLAKLTNLAERDGRLADARALAGRWRAFTHGQLSEGQRVTPLHREAAGADLATISLLRRTGERAAAHALLESAAPFVERLFAAEPAVFETAMLHAQLLRLRAECLADTGDYTGAEGWLAQEIAMLEPWAEFPKMAGFIQGRLDEARGLVADLATLSETAATAAAGN
jgi:tetratricopeptide (TPR) repeat protein